ncbi:MAG: hypothetical protein Q4F95_06340 [Oscillospiraceae bacterium]|nr:hypothetical protein [Oscillospiraceae bacterium]
MVEEGYVSDVNEAFIRYLGTDEYRSEVERDKPGAEETIEIIHSAGGKAVLAHPGLIRTDKEKFEKLLEQLCGYGLDGIECLYTEHSDIQTQYFERLASDKGLIITAGSDFHGERIKEKNLLGMDVDIQLDWLTGDSRRG